MKKHLLHLIIGTFLIMLFGFQQTMAQEKKASKVHITITEGEEVTTDTTFELKEGQDPEMIKKIISHMAGDDLHKVHVSKDVHMSHSGDKEMVWVSSGDDKVWDAKHGMEKINLDSIKEAHKDAKVLVVKNKNGEITVKELDDDDDIHFDDDHGEHHEMMYLEAGEDGKVVHIKKMKSGKKVMMISEDGDVHKEHKVIILTEEGDCEGKEKKIEIIVHGDEDMEWVEKGEGDENVDVYVIKKDDGEEVKVVKKKIRVEIEKEDETGEKTEKVEKKKKK